MMSVVALHLVFSKAGPRRGRPPPLFPVSEPLRGLGHAPPDLFGQVFLHQEGLAFITILIFRACEINRLGDTNNGPVLVGSSRPMSMIIITVIIVMALNAS